MVQQRIESKFNSTEKIPRQNSKKKDVIDYGRLKGKCSWIFFLLRWNIKM